MDALKRAGPGVEFVMNVPLICSQPRGLQAGMGAHQLPPVGRDNSRGA